MSQNPKVYSLEYKKKSMNNTLTDKDKIVFAYHYFEQENPDEACKVLSSISQSYYIGQFFKDISRALLCQATYKTTENEAHGKESEFYLVVYRLTKHVVGQKLMFNQSGHFYQLRDELFKDFEF